MSLLLIHDNLRNLDVTCLTDNSNKSYFSFREVYKLSRGVILMSLGRVLPTVSDKISIVSPTTENACLLHPHLQGTTYTTKMQLTFDATFVYTLSR